MRCRPGFRPGGRPTFLCAQESRQRKRPQVCDPFAALRGKPASRVLRGAPQNSLRAARFVQTTAASQSTKRVHAALHAPPRKPRAAGAATGGNSERAIASLGPAHAARSARALGAERSDGPLGFHHPSARAEERRAWGGRMHRRMHALRALTHCGCLNGAAQQRSEFRSAAPRLSTAGCPEAKRRGHAKWGRLSLVPFFGETKKGTAPPGAHPGRQRFQQKAEIQ